MPKRARKKLTACEAKLWLQARGLNFMRDFHELRSGEKDLILEAAQRASYRRRKGASGSKARMYFQYLQRQKSC